MNFFDFLAWTLSGGFWRFAGAICMAAVLLATVSSAAMAIIIAVSPKAPSQ